MGSSPSTELALSGPCSVALAKAVHGSQTPRRWTIGTWPWPKNQKMQRDGLRRVYKEREAGSAVGHLASGMWDDKTVHHSVKGSFPFRKAQIQKTGPRGCTSYEFAHILNAVIFYFFLASHCQVFSESTSSLNPLLFCAVNYTPNDNGLKSPKTIKCKRNIPSQMLS